MGRRRTYSDDELAAAVRVSESIAGVLRLLGIRPAGGSHFHISKRIKRLGLDTSHFTGQAHRGGKVLPRKTSDDYLVRQPPDTPRKDAQYLRRSLIEIGRDYTCEICGTDSTWQGAPIILHVDHIDGDYTNCLRDNLRFLCPNCHSQTATYCRQLPSRGRSKSAN